jgi:hypothetical protein
VVYTAQPEVKHGTWRAEAASTKAVTELLHTITGNNDFVCTREMWKAAIQGRDDLLVKNSAKKGDTAYGQLELKMSLK